MKDQKILPVELPSVLKGAQANWIVKDDLGNEVQEGEQVFVLENGGTIHVAAIEDYLIEKLGAKFAKTEGTENGVPDVILLSDGTWISTEDVEDYFIEVLGAQVYERKSINAK